MLSREDENVLNCTLSKEQAKHPLRRDVPPALNPNTLQQTLEQGFRVLLENVAGTHHCPRRLVAGRAERRRGSVGKAGGNSGRLNTGVETRDGTKIAPEDVVSLSRLLCVNRAQRCYRRPIATQEILDGYLPVLDSAGQGGLIGIYAGALDDNLFTRILLITLCIPGPSPPHKDEDEVTPVTVTLAEVFSWILMDEKCIPAWPHSVAKPDTQLGTEYMFFGDGAKGKSVATGPPVSLVPTGANWPPRMSDWDELG
ncbi:hypothetical protein K488DRAFT_74933 [Vararia minispora EC-137]|uniref:Uncharacterized protein n=1 Tax=Vararia minispora EC-137 TaxID=1314806 RepID=A0ACB8Q5G6_9AGAM|nr:hypothetical protein K488DRAFT_74933 [Vararia minispora EC-137]